MIILSSYPLSEENNRRIAERAASYGWTFLPAPDDRERAIARIGEHIAEADVYFGGRLTEEQWERARKLSWIHVPWAGVNSLFQVEAIRRSPVVVTNSSGVMSDAVADQVLAYMLMLNRDLPAQLDRQRRRSWERYETPSSKRRRLRGRTLGLIGYGAIGRAIAERARGFGMQVMATRRTAGETPPELDRLLDPAGLPHLLAASDFVVVALPLTEETRGAFGIEQFRMMKPGAFFINIARGAIVVEAGMIEALRDGTIAGAALDVFETEPLPSDSPLWEMKNVIVTPHSAGGFDEFGDETTELFLENLRRRAAGEPLLNVVRKQDGY
jgi:phosphoglycerate dehydrogenase-like enzyme